MCGIFGYIGKPGANKTILTGLKRLEYRGYDSWGVAVKHNGSIDLEKNVGAIGDIDLSDERSRACIGIGHTRWATHGGVTANNAHPHFATDNSFVLAQNGIVENYQKLKRKLEKKGYVFKTQTDTEVIVRLVEEKRKRNKDLTEATRLAFLDLTGRNTIIVLSSEEDHIVAVRNGSPLVIGIADQEYFISSDTLSFADKTDSVILVEDNEMIEYKDEKIRIYDATTGKKRRPKITTLDHASTVIDKGGYDHFMIKEIVEQKDTIREAVQYTEEELASLVTAIKKANPVYTVGAGTAGFAAGQIAYFLRKIALVPTVELKSYEIDSFHALFDDNDLVLAVSQSGETADTIEALEFAKEAGASIASIVNMIGSTTTRMSDYSFLTRSGPEICVASTKAFTAQISWGYALAHAVAGTYDKAIGHIEDTSNALSRYFSPKNLEQVQRIAKLIKKPEHFFVLGKGANSNIALEGALKVKEITYKHFEGFAAGELKHGVIALIEKGTPVFIIVSPDEHRDDMLTATAEVKSRGALTIGISTEDNDLFDYVIKVPDVGPTQSIVNVIPFQLLSYFLGVELGNNVDRPRNLAKSVTVK